MSEHKQCCSCEHVGLIRCPVCDERFCRKCYEVHQEVDCFEKDEDELDLDDIADMSDIGEGSNDEDELDLDDIADMSDIGEGSNDEED